MENDPFKQPSASAHDAASNRPSGSQIPSQTDAIGLTSPVKPRLVSLVHVHSTPSDGKTSSAQPSPQSEAKPDVKKAKDVDDKPKPRRLSNPGVKDKNEVFQALKGYIQQLGGELPDGWRCEVVSSRPHNLLLVLSLIQSQVSQRASYTCRSSSVGSMFWPFIRDNSLVAFHVHHSNPL
jgi:hypothetical protein